jgi:hypothetical protein
MRAAEEASRSECMVMPSGFVSSDRVRAIPWDAGSEALEPWCVLTTAVRSVH